MDQDEHMLTTIDNPYNPFTHYEDWYAFDRDAGYNTPGLLARVTLASDSLTEKELERAIERAIEEIVRENVLGLFRRVTKSSKFGLRTTESQL